MTINDELDRMWKEVVVAYFKVISQHVRRRSDENYERSVTRLRSVRMGFDSRQGQGYSSFRHRI